MQLTEATITEIRNSGEGNRAIARRLGISPGTVSRIRNGKKNGALVIHKGSGNVFADLGVKNPKAALKKAKAEFERAHGNGKLTTPLEPPRATILGLVLAPDMEFKDWAAIFYDSALKWETANWVLADALNHPHAETDEGVQLIAEVLKHPRFARLTPGRITNIKSIGKRYTLDERMDMLSWSHHEEAAYIEDHTVRAQELKKAQAKNLTIREFREQVASKKKVKGKKHATGSVVSDNTGDLHRDEIRAAGAPTLEDFNECRKKVGRALRDFRDIFSDPAIEPKGIATATAPLIASLQELERIGSALA